jgi:hypothetical protein
MSLALRLVPVDSVTCSWCGVRNGLHAMRCYVQYQPGYKPPEPSRAPISRELYNAAVERGDTVGHQWGNRG